MCSKRRGMINWLKEHTSVGDSNVHVIVSRAFKHDTDQMAEERISVMDAISLKKAYEVSGKEDMGLC